MSQSYRLKLSRQALRLKVASRIPARLEVLSPLVLDRTGGIYTVSLDIDQLGDSSAGFDALAPTTTRGDLIARGEFGNDRLPIGPSGYALMSDGIDPAWTGYTRAGTSVTRTWLEKVSERFSVKDFGAVGDGVTLDNVVINLALAAIKAAGGGTLWFPYGTYLVGSAIDIREMSNLVIDGDPGVIIKATAAFDASDNILKSSVIMGLNFTGTAPPTGRIYKNITITANITVDGTLQNQANLPAPAIGGFGFNSCTIEIMDVDNVNIEAKSIGGYGNGPVISTHDPRITAPTFTTYVINAAGTGYAVGDTFYSDDTGNNFAEARFRVDTVNGSGGVTAITPIDRGIYLTFSGINSATTAIAPSAGSGCTVQLGGTVTVDNAIKNPRMHCIIENCCRGRMMSYQSGSEPNGIAGSGLQIGAGVDLDVDVTLINVGGPGVDFFNCKRGRIHVNTVSVNAAALIGTVQARGSLHSDFGLSDMVITGNAPSVDLRGAMDSGLSYFFNGGTSTPGPRRCFFDFVIDGSIAADAIGTPGFRMMGGSVAGVVGQAKDNFGRVYIKDANGIGATLYDCVQNDIDFNILNPGQIASNYIGLKFFSQIDQAGGGCTDNRFSLRCIDTRPLVTAIVTTDGTSRHARNKFFTYNISVPTGAIFDLPSGSYQVYQERGFTTTATSAGTLTLDKNSDNIQVLTGATTHTVVLPVAATLPLGHRFEFYNESSGAVTVQSSGLNTVLLLGNGLAGEVILNTNSGTGAAIWTLRYFGTAVFGGKRFVVQNSLTLAGTDGTTLTFQGTDTYVGRATTDTLTNKTYDTAGTGNSFSINGLAATANTGTGAVVRANSPTLVAPALGAATATTINGVTIDNNAWTSYTPTVSAQTGTITSTSNISGAFKVIGKTAFVFATATITNAGTGAGSIIFTLPGGAPALANNYVGTAYESGLNATSGAAITVQGTQTVWAKPASGGAATFIATNAVVNITIVYQTT